MDLSSRVSSLPSGDFLPNELLERLPIAIYTCDAAGFIRTFNSLALNAWGRSPLENQDKFCGAVRRFRANGTSVTAEHTIVAETLMSGEERSGDISIERPDGTRASYFMTVRPESHGGAVCVLYEGPRLSHSFMRALGHELRTPLAAILGFTDILQKQWKSERTSSPAFLERVSLNAEKMLSSLDMAMGFARLEAESPQVKAVSPLEIITNCLMTMSVDRASSLVRFDVHAEDATTVRTDAAIVRQALLRLLQNALRFTPPGGSITIRVLRTNSTVILEVEDTGVGIDSVMQAAIRDGKCGMGLELARRLAFRVGGRISLERSQPERGSTFHLEIPQL